VAVSPPDRIRETAKWTIVAFAGVGAVLVAGLQVSEIGSVRGLRLFGACFGAATAVVGIGVAIWKASSVLAPQTATFADLRENPALAQRIEQEPTFLGGFSYESVKELLDDYRHAFTAYRNAQFRRLGAGHGVTAAVRDLHAYAAATSSDVPPPTASGEDFKAVETAFEELSRVVDFLRSIVLYEKTYEAWRVAQRAVFWAAALAFVGIGLFAYAANPPQSTDKPKTPDPTQLVSER
jgi:hypothetical protein